MITFRRQAFVAVMLVAAAASAARAAETETLRNDRVVVLRGTFAGGAPQTIKGPSSSVTVYFTDGVLEVTTDGETRKLAVKRGQATPDIPGPRTIRNAGKAAIDYVRVEFVGRGSRQTWGRTGLSPNYALLHEDALSRVYEIRIAHGAVEPQHTHMDRVVVCLSGAKLSHLLPDGTSQASSMDTGEVAWRLAATHVGRNVGATDFWAIAIEPK